MQANTALKLTGVLSTLAGIFLLYFFVRNTWLAYSSLDWPAAQGIVLSSHIETETTSNRTTRRARIEYEYDVPVPGSRGEGKAMKRYRSQRIHASGNSGGPGLVSSYPAGKVIEVRYDPEDFAYSYLLKESTDFFPMIGGLIFAAVGVFLFLSSRRLASA